MSKYARYQKVGPAPWRVQGWVDKVNYTYPDHPPTDTLRPMTDEEWKNRNGHWGVAADNSLVRMSPTPLPFHLMRAGLVKSFQDGVRSETPIPFTYEGETYFTSIHDITILERTQGAGIPILLHTITDGVHRPTAKEISLEDFPAVAQAFYDEYAKRRHTKLHLLEKLDAARTVEDLQAIIEEM